MRQNDKALAALIGIAERRQVGVRVGHESSFIPNKRRERSVRGWIEIRIGMYALFDKHLTRRRLANDFARQLAHELGHMLIAPRSRRFRRDYGIPIDTGKPRDKWDLDEMKAQFVENYLLCRCGFGRHMRLRSWDSWVTLASKRSNIGSRRRNRCEEALSWWETKGKIFIDRQLAWKSPRKGL